MHSIQIFAFNKIICLCQVSSKNSCNHNTKEIHPNFMHDDIDNKILNNEVIISYL